MKARARLVVISALAVLVLVLLFLPVIPQNVTALQLNGGYLLTDNSPPQGSQGPVEYQQIAEVISQNSSFMKASGGQNYSFSSVHFEGGAGWSAWVLVYDHYGNQLINVCGSIRKAMTDTIYVVSNTTLPLQALQNMTGPGKSLNIDSFTILHVPPTNRYSCISLISIGPPITYRASSSLMFAVSELGLTYVPDWGLVFRA